MNDIKDFVRERSHLFWYIKDLDRLSDESVVGHVLNYGNFRDFLNLVEIFGLNKVAGIFRRQSGRERSNYLPKIKNYFTLYFDKHEPRDFKR